MKLFISIISLLTILFISCEDFYIIADTRVKGSVFDSTTFEKIPDAEVTVYKNARCKVGEIKLCDKWEILESVKSDEKGNYKIKFNDIGNEYRISASKDGYYKSGFWYKVSRSIEDVDCYLFPQETLNMTIKNNTPYNEEDLLNLTIENNGNREPEILNFSFTGTNIDTSFEVTVYGNFTHNILWIVNKYGTENNYSESIFCEVEKENNFSINY